MLSGDSVMVRGYDGEIPFTKDIDLDSDVYTTRPGGEPTQYTTVFDEPLFLLNKHDSEFSKKKYRMDLTGMYGNMKPEYETIYKHFRNMVYDNTLVRIAYYDIETTSIHGFPDVENPIESVVNIAIIQDENVHAAGFHEFRNDTYPIDYPVYYTQVTDELALFKWFVKTITKLGSDCISGWYTDGFDLPYLKARAEKIGYKNFLDKLSPFGKSKVRVDKDTGEEIITVFGLPSLDLLPLYKKYKGDLNRYSLDFVANHVLGVGKLEYSGTLQELYERDYEKFTAYNIIDTIRVYQIDKKKNITTQAFALAYLNMVNYDDINQQTRMWGNYISMNLLEDNKKPPMFMGNHRFPFEGGYVKEVKPGAYNNVATFDIKSEYPNIMIQYNISPETLVGSVYPSMDKDYLTGNPYPDISANHTMAANGVLFRNDKVGFLPKLVKGLFDKRVENQNIAKGIDAEIDLIRSVLDEK